MKNAIWIWHISACENGNWSKIIQRCLDNGIDYVLVKAGDSVRNSQWTPQVAKDVIAQCHAAGLNIGVWNYSKPSTWQSEAQYLSQCVNEGVDVVILDPEIEWQNDPNARQHAEAFMQALRLNVGNDYPIYFAPFAFPAYHQPFPYYEFSKYCNGVMPQTYWCEMGRTVANTIETCDQQWQAFKAQYPDITIPVMPICNTYGAPYTNVPGTLTKEDLLMFMNHYKDVGFSSYSYDASANFPQFWEALSEFKAQTITNTSDPIVLPPVIDVNPNPTVEQPKQNLLSSIISFILSLFKWRQ